MPLALLYNWSSLLKHQFCKGQARKKHRMLLYAVVTRLPCREGKKSYTQMENVSHPEAHVKPQWERQGFISCSRIKRIKFNHKRKGVVSKHFRNFFCEQLRRVLQITKMRHTALMIILSSFTCLCQRIEGKYFFDRL